LIGDLERKDYGMHALIHTDVGHEKIEKSHKRRQLSIASPACPADLHRKEVSKQWESSTGRWYSRTQQEGVHNFRKDTIQKN
jgi:hypothetical protein